MAVEITTWAELQAINSVLDGDYILMNDLGSGDADYDTYASSTANGGDGWDSIGNVSNDFIGIFDGGNFTISDLFISGGQQWTGLFGATYFNGISSNHAIIKNLKVLNVDITAFRYVGAIVGDGAYVDLINCSSSGTISVHGNYCGGLCGLYSYGEANNCISNINLSASGDTYDDVGGAFGTIGNTTVSNCYSTGNVINTMSREVTGGFVGSMSSSGVVINCYSTGNVTGGTGNYKGGFVGENKGTLNNCYSTGNVTSDGGIFGGFCGYSSGAENNCFWDTIASSVSTDEGAAVGKTTTEMNTLSTYSTWAITTLANFIPASPTIWYINDTYEYPKLAQQYVGYEQLSGKVTLNAADIEGAEVKVLRPSDNTIINEGTTDVNGDYSLGVEIGTYHVLVQHENGGTKYNAKSYPFVVVS